MNNLKIYILILLGFVSVLELKAQQDSVRIIKHTLFLTGKSTGHKIILRWAPNSAGVWSMSNHSGYFIERLAFKDSTDMLSAPFVLLTPDTLKPWPLDAWEPIANTASGDKYAAIAAQALYGKRNELEKPLEESSYLSKAREFENLFSAAMLAAEYSRNAAIASALRFEDENIDTTMNYVYRIYSLASSDSFRIDTAYMVIDAGNIEPLLPVEITTVASEKAIYIQWSRDWELMYSGWYIERSEDGQNFTKLNTIPYIDSPFDEYGKKTEMVTFIDSVPVNYKPYWYRVTGINTFAELSPTGIVTKAMGRDITPPTPASNIIAKQIAPGKMQITWDYDGDMADLDGFLIGRSEGVHGEQQPLTPEKLSPDTRVFYDSNYNELADNWYLIYSMDTAGNASVGFPQYGTIIDSIPPNPPTGLTGNIDTNGVVTVHWNLGEERDILGYKVYYTNQGDHVFANVNNELLQDTIFTDTINIKVLTEEIFYKITAVDATRNHSKFSEVLVLKKPDVIPPVSPIFTDYKVTKDGIKLTYAQSTSHDVVRHFLYRKDKIEGTDWELIYETDSLKTYDTFIDTTTIPGTLYQYKLIALDDDGLQSKWIFQLTLRAIDFSAITSVKYLEANYNKKEKTLRLDWSYPKEGNFTFALYRAVDGGGFNFYKSFEGHIRSFSETLKTNHIYEYTLKVVYPDGKKSAFCPIKIVSTNE